MKTKKILSFVLAAVMMLSMGTTVFASEVAPVVDPNEITNDGGSQNVTVTYGMSESFTVTIPSSIAIDNDGEVFSEIVASNVVIGANKKLNVAISTEDNLWELVDVNEPTNKLEYAIQTTHDAEYLESGDVILTIDSGEAYNSSVTRGLRFTIGDIITKSGEYTDTLTFTVSVEDGTIPYTISEPVQRVSYDIDKNGVVTIDASMVIDSSWCSSLYINNIYVRKDSTNITTTKVSDNIYTFEYIGDGEYVIEISMTYYDGMQPEGYEDRTGETAEDYITITKVQ